MNSYLVSKTSEYDLRALLARSAAMVRVARSNARNLDCCIRSRPSSRSIIVLCPANPLTCARVRRYLATSCATSARYRLINADLYWMSARISDASCNNRSVAAFSRCVCRNICRSFITMVYRALDALLDAMRPRCSCCKFIVVDLAAACSWRRPRFIVDLVYENIWCTRR